MRTLEQIKFLGRFKFPNAATAGFLLFSRLLIGLLFIFSGLSKLIQPIEYFEIAVGQYSIVPDAIIHLVSLVIPWSELLFGSYLFLGYMEQRAATALAILTGAFQVILGQALGRQLPMDECGCFGAGFIHLTLYQSFALDTVLVLVLIQLATSGKRTSFNVDDRLLKSKTPE